MHSGAAYLRAQGGWAAEQSMPQWGERRHTLEQLNHRSKIGLGRSMNADLRRPHTMAGVATESDLNHRRVVPVLGAQFRSRPTSSADDRSSMQGSASCPGCAALNSKLHKNHKQLAELAELRGREKEARTLAERCKERELELEEGWRSHQQKIGLEFERMRCEAHDGVQKAREAAEAADARAARLQAPSPSAIARRPSPASMFLAPRPHRHPRPHPRPRPTTYPSPSPSLWPCPRSRPHTWLPTAPHYALFVARLQVALERAREEAAAHAASSRPPSSPPLKRPPPPSSTSSDDMLAQLSSELAAAQGRARAAEADKAALAAQTEQLQQRRAAAETAQRALHSEISRTEVELNGAREGAASALAASHAAGQRWLAIGLPPPLLGQPWLGVERQEGHKARTASPCPRLPPRHHLISTRLGWRPLPLRPNYRSASHPPARQARS